MRLWDGNIFAHVAPLVIFVECKLSKILSHKKRAHVALKFVPFKRDSVALAENSSRKLLEQIFISFPFHARLDRL